MGFAEFLQVAIIVFVMAMALMWVFVWGHAKCRDCGVPIQAYTTHKCPKSGRRYTAK